MTSGLGRESRELIEQLLGQIARFSRTAIAAYVPSVGGMVEFSRSDVRFFPAYCHEVWRLGKGAGRDLCNRNMCGRAREAYSSSSPHDMMCHAGLTSVAEPILVEGEPVAVIQYGAFVQSDETDHSRRIQMHEQAMAELGASPAEAGRLRELLFHPSTQRSPTDLLFMQKILRFIHEFVPHFERRHRTEQRAIHEVTQKLTAAVSEAELLFLSFEPGTPSALAAERVMGAIEAGATVISNLKRGQYLPPDYRFSRHALARFVQTASQLCLAEAQKKDLEIRIDPLLLDEKHKVEASDVHLQEAFNNLFQNAVKYSYASTAFSQRFMSIRGRHVQGGYELSISNYGVGIEADEKARIFEEGYRGRIARQEYRSGSGLGLPLAKRIIEAHGGSLHFTSEPVSETLDDSPLPFLTRFTVWLPNRQRQRTDVHD